MAEESHPDRAAEPRHARVAKRRRNPHPLQVGLIAVSALAIVAGGALVGKQAFSSPSVDRSSTATADPTPVHLPAPPPSVSASDVPAGSDINRFTAEFEAFARGLSADVGIVVRPVGAGPAAVAAGDWSIGPAWSTIKVPLAIAGLRAADPPTVTDPMRAAIRQSDNAGAELIWQSLGDPATAARKVQDVLTEAGDPTVVESEKVRPEFSPFGQTYWSLADQATFVSSAVCDARNEPIMSLMSQIEADQGWGLATIPGAQYKGGWGPSEAGTYLVRQMGIIPVAGGSAVVTVGTEPDSGSFHDGTMVLTRIADWLSEHADLLPAGNCL